MVWWCNFVSSHSLTAGDVALDFFKIGALYLIFLILRDFFLFGEFVFNLGFRSTKYGGVEEEVEL